MPTPMEMSNAHLFLLCEYVCLCVYVYVFAHLPNSVCVSQSVSQSVSCALYLRNQQWQLSVSTKVVHFTKANSQYLLILLSYA